MNLVPPRLPPGEELEGVGESMKEVQEDESILSHNEDDTENQLMKESDRGRYNCAKPPSKFHER